MYQIHGVAGSVVWLDSYDRESVDFLIFKIPVNMLFLFL
ncbi:hypothetical protein [Morganella phage IME1369_01]|nr:hypothetical protein [Morganella phage IME1369_01]